MREKATVDKWQHDKHICTPPRTRIRFFADRILFTLVPITPMSSRRYFPIPSKRFSPSQWNAPDNFLFHSKCVTRTEQFYFAVKAAVSKLHCTELSVTKYWTEFFLRNINPIKSESLKGKSSILAYHPINSSNDLFFHSCFSIIKTKYVPEKSEQHVSPVLIKRNVKILQ
jgi:hypothetical protein